MTLTPGPPTHLTLGDITLDGVTADAILERGTDGDWRPAAGTDAPAVLALDLSVSATGICTPTGALATYRTLAHGDDRLEDIALHVAGHAVPGGLRRGHLVAMEGGVVRSKAAFILGMLHGAVRAELMSRGIPYLVVPPAAIKTYATGKGNATKPTMRMELYKRAGLDVADDNQVDAWWLRALVLDLAGAPQLDLPKTHRRALDKLTLPKELGDAEGPSAVSRVSGGVDAPDSRENDVPGPIREPDGPDAA